MKRVQEYSDAVRELATIASGEVEGEWLGEVRSLLSEQSEDTLSYLRAQYAGFSQLELDSLDSVITAYVHEFSALPEEHMLAGPMNRDEFFWRASAVLVPLVVEHYRPMLGKQARDHYGDMVQMDEVDLWRYVSEDINDLLCELVPSEHTLTLVQGHHLFAKYGRPGGCSQPCEDDLLWMSGHAFALLPHVDAVFTTAFDRGLAEDLMGVETPVLREGVL
jgi:hypothetical protein